MADGQPPDEGGPVEPDPYMEEEDTDTDSMAGLDPSHPLLARAQAALKHQLVEARLRVEGVIREKTEDLKVRVCGTSHPVSQPHWASVVHFLVLVSTRQMKSGGLGAIRSALATASCRDRRPLQLMNMIPCWM